MLMIKTVHVAGWDALFTARLQPKLNKENALEKLKTSRQHRSDSSVPFKTHRDAAQNKPKKKKKKILTSRTQEEINKPAKGLAAIKTTPKIPARKDIKFGFKEDSSKIKLTELQADSG